MRPIDGRYADEVATHVRAPAPETDEPVDLLGIWPGRSDGSPVVHLVHPQYSTRGEGHLLGLRWPLDTDPEDGRSHSCTSAELATRLYYRQLVEPPGRALSRYRRSREGIWWGGLAGVTFPEIPGSVRHLLPDQT